MAKTITAQAIGGEQKTNLEADTVADLKEQLGLNGNYTATVNGQPADEDQELVDFNHVTFAPSVKGGAK